MTMNLSGVAQCVDYVRNYGVIPQIREPDTSGTGVHGTWQKQSRSYTQTHNSTYS